MTGKAAEELLNQLHGSLAAHLLDQIKSAQGAGEPLPASLVKEIREFLKDNGVESLPQPGSPVGRLLDEAKSLPFPGEPPSRLPN